MAGLTTSGFVPETLANIKARIENQLELLNPGFDFSPESPDGQLINIFSYELFTAWTQLAQVYNSYDPDLATGAALRNLGQLTGIPYKSANRSYAPVDFVGTGVVPAGTLLLDGEGREWSTVFAVTAPATAQAICTTPGPVPATALSIVSLKTNIAGITEVTQPLDGVIGTNPMTDQEYRNLRSATVMRNYSGTVDVMQARLLELGIEQASVFNNNTALAVGSVPANTIAVTVGEQGAVTDESIASVIMETIAVGCPTYGTTTVTIEDMQGYSHDVNFTKATAVVIEITLDVTYLDEDTAGAEKNIKDALVAFVNGLKSGENVVWSHLFQYITPYANAQVNTLLINSTGNTPAISNVAIADTEFASLVSTDITYTET